MVCCTYVTLGASFAYSAGQYCLALSSCRHAIFGGGASKACAISRVNITLHKVQISGSAYEP